MLMEVSGVDLGSVDDEKHPALRLVEPGETVQILAEAVGARLLVTDRRLVVASGQRVTLAVGFDGLRRISSTSSETDPRPW